MPLDLPTFIPALYFAAGGVSCLLADRVWERVWAWREARRRRQQPPNPTCQYRVADVIAVHPDQVQALLAANPQLAPATECLRGLFALGEDGRWLVEALYLVGVAATHPEKQYLVRMEHTA
jgi:hypothetical protein